MNRIKEIMSQITKKSWIISGGVALVFIVLGVTVWPFSVLKEGDVSGKADTETQEFIAQASDQIFIKQDSSQDQYQTTGGIQEVYVGVVADNASRKVIDDTKKISCGYITFATVYVQGPAVLTNSLKALFEDKVVTDFAPGNIIPSYHPELTFEKVTIDKGVAKVYLGGNFGGTYGGWCDASLALAQIVETAKTFSTVTSVEVYQGQEKVY